VVEAGLVSGDAGAAAADEAVAGADRAALERLFAAYAGFGVRDSAAGGPPELDSFRTAKLAREAGLLGPRLRAQELDVLFAAAARHSASRRWVLPGSAFPRGFKWVLVVSSGLQLARVWLQAGPVSLPCLACRPLSSPDLATLATLPPHPPRLSCRLPFDGFLKLLALVADKKGVPVGEVVGAVAALQGPAVRGTTPEAVKWHDDKSLYTGGRRLGGRGGARLSIPAVGMGGSTACLSAVTAG
jgi:hypothetical protein